jgi:histone deacetylase 1/2
MPNHNTPEYLDRIRERVFEVLRRLPAAPSAEALRPSAPNILPDEDDAMDRDLDTERAKDTKIPMKLWDKQIHPENSFDDMEEDFK